MRTRLVSTIAITAAAFAIAAGVAAPVQSAFGGDHSASSTHQVIEAGRSHLISSGH